MQAKYKIATTLLLTSLVTLVLKLVMQPPLVNTELRTEFWLNKTHAAEKFNIVVGGDSRIYRGFSIEDMENEVDELSGINLGYSSAGFSKKYVDFMVGRLAADRPRILVFGLSANAFTDESNKNESLDQYQAVHGFDLYKGLYLSRYLKYFAPYKISDLKNAFYLDTVGVVQEKFYPNGWTSSDLTPSSDSVAFEIYTKIFTKDKVNDSIVTAFLHQVDSLQKTGIQIIAFRTPTNDPMTAIEDSLSGLRFTDLATHFQENNMTWIDFKNSDFRTYDGSHLDSKSARKLGKSVGETIKKILE